MSSNKVKQSNACAKDISETQMIRDHNEGNCNSVASSLREISIIETMESFLEENGGSDVDPKVLRVIAETLTKRFQSTSPGTLQDVTMDNSYSVYCQSHRSCNGAASPTSQGSKSVRDFEEQTAALHKEIFNLKLKLFFMEESMPAYKQAQATGQDPLLKQVVEKKVEVEVMRKELLDNQQLLRESMDTINDMQRMIEAKEQKHQEEIDTLNHKISLFEMERELQQESKCLLEHVNSNEDYNNNKEISELKEKLKDSEEQNQDFQNQISKLDQILMERDENIKSLELKMIELKGQNEDLKVALQKKTNDFESAENQKLRQELQELRIRMADNVCVLDETEDKLKQKTQNYEKALKTIQKLILNNGNQQKEITKLKNQSKTFSNTTLPHQINLHSAGLSGLECLEGSAFHKSISDSEAVLAPNEALISKLKKELKQAKSEAENADRWRKECADVCGVLTNRLEELAGFLNSLLKQKDVLGILAADRRKAMRKAVDRSLDLSKSLNMTLSISGLSITDISLTHLSNLSQILGYEDGEEQFTFNSHVDHSRLSLDFSKTEKQFLKKESSEKRKSNDMKKDRRSLPLPPQENQSESEAWSEPDRLVSMARIGLDEHSTSLSKEITAKKMVSSESDCDPLNNSRNNSKTRVHEKVSNLEQMIAERDNRILDIQCQLVEADNRLKKENLRVLEMTNRIESLEQHNDELQQEINVLTNEMELKTQYNQSELLKEIEEKTLALEQLQCELNDVKEKHGIALTSANEELKEKLSAQKNELEAIQEKNLQELELKHKCELKRDYIALVQYEEIKAQLLELQRQYIEAQRTIENLTDNEHELKQNLLEIEMEARSLKKQLDESTLQASKAIMERTKAFNEKLQCEKAIEELKLQSESFEMERNSLNEHVQKLEEQIAAFEALKVQNVHHQTRISGDASASGYTSEEVPNAFSDNTNTVNSKSKVAQRSVKRQNNSSSPDLGIESDAGRLSGTETKTTIKTERKKEERVSNIKEDLEDGNENIDPKDNQHSAASNTSLVSTLNHIQHDCAKVEQENVDLRRKLLRTKQAFEDTYEKLRIANQRKAQIEKDIKNQILKTHNVLRNVRTNMENEL